jgi:methanogenic corrinoid protein MtbC1
MADSHNSDAKNEPVESVIQLGSKVRQIDEASSDDVSEHIDPLLYASLKNAALSKDPDACKHEVNAALMAGTRPEDLADFYVPALARDMGDQWCVDQLSFAGVTIGVSRLQAMMRELGPNWTSDNATQPEANAILLLVPREVYHTLGAIVLSSQLRRMGVSVKLLLGGKPDDIVQRLSRTSYQAVFISASCGETLESLRRIVDIIKTNTKTPMPVVIGGSILDVQTTNDVTALTGADHATRMPDEALRLCGLQENTPNKAHVKGGI